MDLRSHFPVLEHMAYLNAGSVGPVPRQATEAAHAELADQLENGRGGKPSFEHALELGDRLRGRIAAVMGCDDAELALTGATTDGVNTVLGGLDLQPGDEILTTDEEHPGLLAPLGLARERRGVQVRVVPFDRVAEEVRPATRLVACSHVSWLNGQVVDTAGLSDAGVPVLLDGAQGTGAVPVDVKAIGCDYYACSGQKWLCGPQGSGYLYVRAERIEDLAPPAPGYGSLADPLKALELDLREGAARYEGGLLATHHTAWALASLDVLEAPGLDAVHARAADPVRPSGRRAHRRGAHGRSARALDAGLVGGRGSRGHGRAAGRAGIRHPQPPRHAVCARLGGRVVLGGGARPAGVGRLES